MKTGYYLFIICLFLSVCAYSQKKEEPFKAQEDTITTKYLSEVVITALRTFVPLREMAAAISVVTPRQLNTMQRTIAADEALRLVPGVKVDNGTSGSRVHLYIRGQGILSERGIRGIQVLIDNIPANDPGGYCPDLYDVDWKTVKDIEVVKGLAASSYGSSANGGVVNIITQDGGKKPVNAMLFGSAGSNGYWKILGQVDGTEGNVNYRISYSHMQGHGYRQHQAFLGDNFSEKLNWTPSNKVQITQLLNFTNYFNQNSEGMNLYRIQNYGYTAANTDAAPFNEFQKTVRLSGAITARFLVGKQQDFQIKGYCRTTDYKEQSNGGVDYKPYINPGFSAQYDLHSGKEKIKNSFSLGADFESQTTTEHNFGVYKDSFRQDSYFSQATFDNNVIQINQMIHQRSAGIYLIDELDIMNKVFATLNVRYDYIYNQLIDKKMYQTPDSSGSDKKVFEKPTFRFGIVYYPIKAFSIYANYGTGFLPPTNDELYNNPIRWGGFNTSIKPSISQGGELGIRGEVGKGFYYNITGFILNTKNEFYRYREPWMGNTSDVYGNIGASSRYGIEAFLSCSPVKNIIIDLAYTYSHFQYTSPDSVKNQWIPESPQHMLTAEIAYNFLKHFTVTVNTEYQSRWYIFSDPAHYNTYTIEPTTYQPAITYNSWVSGYNIYSIDLNYNWKLGGLKGDLGLFVKNIFDQHYYGFTEPDNPPDFNCYQPAPGREFFVSLRLKI